MLPMQSNKFINLHKVILNFRTLCTVRPPHIDFGAPFRAKPEEIPEGIWAEENNPKYTSVEEVKDHWHYVERLFPKLRIPEPPTKVSSTGWKAPAENVPDQPYYIKRSRNFMLPVYLDRIYKDLVLITRVNHIYGDIWLFEYELKNYLEEKLGEKVETHVNEIMCRVHIKGSHVDIVKDWLYNKGF